MSSPLSASPTKSFSLTALDIQFGVPKHHSHSPSHPPQSSSSPSSPLLFSSFSPLSETENQRQSQIIKFIYSEGKGNSQRNVSENSGSNKRDQMETSSSLSSHHHNIWKQWEETDSPTKEKTKTEAETNEGKHKNANHQNHPPHNTPFHGHLLSPHENSPSSSPSPSVHHVGLLGPLLSELLNSNEKIPNHLETLMGMGMGIGGTTRETKEKEGRPFASSPSPSPSSSPSSLPSLVNSLLVFYRSTPSARNHLFTRCSEIRRMKHHSLSQIKIEKNIQIAKMYSTEYKKKELEITLEKEKKRRNFAHKRRNSIESELQMVIKMKEIKDKQKENNRMEDTHSENQKERQGEEYKPQDKGRANVILSHANSTPTSLPDPHPPPRPASSSFSSSTKTQLQRLSDLREDSMRQQKAQVSWMMIIKLLMEMEIMKEKMEIIAQNRISASVSELFTTHFVSSHQKSLRWESDQKRLRSQFVLLRSIHQWVKKMKFRKMRQCATDLLQFLTICKTAKDIRAALKESTIRGNIGKIQKFFRQILMSIRSQREMVEIKWLNRESQIVRKEKIRHREKEQKIFQREKDSNQKEKDFPFSSHRSVPPAIRRQSISSFVRFRRSAWRSSMRNYWIILADWKAKNAQKIQILKLKMDKYQEGNGNKMFENSESKEFQTAFPTCPKKPNLRIIPNDAEMDKLIAETTKNYYLGKMNLSLSLDTHPNEEVKETINLQMNP